MTRWTFEDIPDQAGRTAIVTGANTGIGFETARMLSRKGADVVLACRNPDKGQAAVRAIRADNPSGTARFALLDLADLDSVAAFAEAFRAGNARLDLLVDNAGVMVPPPTRTKQGFELQFGTNHLGHFALTAQLFPLLERTPGSRVVVVSSMTQNTALIDFDDLDWTRRRYHAGKAYGQSKLANMLFALELHRRTGTGHPRVTAAHPGWTATDLGRTAGALARFVSPLVGMKPHDGALPTLRAATDPDAESGSYWGPAHFFELKGPPARARISTRAKDTAVAERLWDDSEKLTGVTFAFTPPGDEPTREPA
jgi:NAD(P)-dependent dehydrogenase (short-subunit alcohol dehydrogenase family)